MTDEQQPIESVEALKARRAMSYIATHPERTALVAVGGF